MMEGSQIMNAIKNYSSWSGQTVNAAKSSVFFSQNLDSPTMNKLSHHVAIKKQNLRGKYLGLPLHIPRSRKFAFQDIKEKILSKIEG